MGSHSKMNAHVIKWCRWNHWLCRTTRRQLGMLYWITMEKFERGEEEFR